MLFLTGGSGFLGSRFIELHAERISIVALVRHNPIPSGLIKHVPGDLLDLNSLVDGTRGCRYILHCGGATPNRAYAEGHYAATLTGTRNLIEAAKKNHIRRFIFISSSSVTRSTGPYALSKLQAEEEVQRSGLDWTILRPKTIIGSGARDLGRMLKFWSRARWIPVIGDGTYVKQPVFVDDLCRAMFSALENDSSRGRIITAAGTEAVPFNEFVSRFARALGNSRYRMIHLPLSMVRPIAVLAGMLNPQWGLNSERVAIITNSHSENVSEFRALLDVEPIGFNEMVERTVAGLHRQGQVD